MNCLLRLLGAAVMMAAGCAAAQGWVPQRHVELIVPNAPGGALDITGRAIHRVWQEMKLLPVTSTVVNRAGGEHAVAYTFLSQKPGDPHFVSLASPVLLANHIAGRLTVTHSDFTPLATVMTEAYLFFVRAESPLKSGRDFVEAMKAKPDALVVATATVQSRISTGLVLQSAGVDIKPVKMVVQPGGQQVPALLGGHIDVAVGPPGQYIAHVESGALRAIASASPKRLGGALASTPTWAELGHAAGTYETWRALIGARGLTPEQVAYWEDVMRKVAESESFQANARRNQSEPVFRGAAETRARMQAQYEQAKKIMTYMGLVK